MFRFLCVFLLALHTWAQPSVEDLLAAKTVKAVEQYAARFEGVLGVAAIDLTSGRRLAFHADTVFPQASVIKIPILISLYHAARAGRLRLDDPVNLTPRDAVAGSGRLRFTLEKGPVTLSIRELATLMIIDSDNTATNKCIDLAGMEEVNRMLAARGFVHTRLLRRMMDAAAAEQSRENLSTADEMASIVEQIYRARIVDAEASREILAIMKRVPSGIHEGLPLETETAAKTGGLPGVRCETGVVYLEQRPFVLSVMSAYIDDRRSPVPDVARLIYPFFEKLSQSNAYGRRIR